MQQHKMGRPTQACKGAVIKARMDAQTAEKLRPCAAKTGLSKSEIVRLGIEKDYQEMAGDPAE